MEFLQNQADTGAATAVSGKLDVDGGIDGGTKTAYTMKAAADATQDKVTGTGYDKGATCTITVGTDGTVSYAFSK